MNHEEDEKLFETASASAFGITETFMLDANDRQCCLKHELGQSELMQCKHEILPRKHNRCFGKRTIN